MHWCLTAPADHGIFTLSAVLATYLEKEAYQLVMSISSTPALTFSLAFACKCVHARVNVS